MAKQGKCTKCKVRWIWPDNLPLSMAVCPQCQEQLQRTSKLSSYVCKDAETLKEPIRNWADIKGKRIL